MAEVDVKRIVGELASRDMVFGWTSMIQPSVSCW